MATQRSTNPHKQVIELGPKTSLRFEASGRQRLLTPGRGPCLLAALVLAITLFCTDGGGAAFYAAAYVRAERTEAYLFRKPGAPLAFLKSDKPGVERFRLQGIVYSSARPIAVINDKPCAPGETFSVRIGDSAEFVRCLEINPGGVHIQPLNGLPALLKLEDGAQVAVQEAQPPGG